MPKTLETFLFRTTGGLMSRVRVQFYRGLGMQIGERCRLEKIRVRRPSQIRMGAHNALSEGTWLWPLDADYTGTRIEIGNSNYFNRNVMIDSCGFVKIGNHTMFGPGVYITDSNHTIDPTKWIAECPMDVGRVVIGDGCWLGSNVTILKDVTLGARCIVAAGAVVTRSFSHGSLIGGNPGRLIKRGDIELPA